MTGKARGKLISYCFNLSVKYCRYDSLCYQIHITHFAGLLSFVFVVCVAFLSLFCFCAVILSVSD